jgi:hypothetical protein
MLLRGSASTKNTVLGTLKPASSARAAMTMSTSVIAASRSRTTTAATASPKSGCGRPTTALSATPGRLSIRLSTSLG